MVAKNVFKTQKWSFIRRVQTSNLVGFKTIVERSELSQVATSAMQFVANFDQVLV